MKLIFIRKNGGSLSFALSKWMIRLGSVGLLVCALGLVALGAFLSKGSRVDVAVIDNWRSQLSEQNYLVEELRGQSSSHSQAVGRQLAEMQARLWRIEALAVHMRDSAGLPDDEFNFDSIPAQGGPDSSLQELLSWSSLETELGSLASRLRQRDKELSILDQILLNRYRDQRALPEGRPILKGWMSSPYGSRVDPFSGKQAWHNGMDFAGKAGADVIAVASGVVVFAGERDGYGHMIEINHGNELSTRYGHHQELLVSAGQAVERGDVIGRMGSTGRSTGPHVHFEVIKNGRPVDPSRFVN